MPKEWRQWARRCDKKATISFLIETGADAAPLLQGSLNIPAAVKDTGYLHAVVNGTIQNDIALNGEAAQPWGQFITTAAHERVLGECIGAGFADATDKSAGIFGAILSNVFPDSGQVCLRRVE